MFLYTAKEKQQIEHLKFARKTGVVNYMDMVAHFFEIGYDVALNCQ